MDVKILRPDIGDIISRHVENTMWSAMGFSHPIGGNTLTTARQEPTELDVKKLEALLATLHSDNKSDKKRMVSLLASMGFTVMTGFLEKPTVHLPERYAEAIKELNEEKAAKKQTNDKQQ